MFIMANIGCIYKSASRKIINLNYIIIILAGALISYPARAEILISVDHVEGTIGALAIVTGTISPHDPEEFLSRYRGLIRGIDPASITMKFAYLDTIGGDVDAAMELGKLLRENGFDAFVLPGARCYSSCVYLLAAGRNKTVRGRVGIHRPYFSEGFIDSGKVRGSLNELLNNSRNYFSSMNIPPGLADEMFSTPPQDLKILNDSELRSYRLDQMDIIESEISQLETARRLGVDRSVLVEYFSEINFSCKRFQGAMKILPNGNVDIDTDSMKKCNCSIAVEKKYPESIRKVACVKIK